MLIDECIPFRVRRILEFHECVSVSHLGWTGTKDTTLLRRAKADGFDALVTCDRGFEHRTDLQIAILILPTNDWSLLQSYAGAIRTKLHELAPGQCTVVPP